MQATIDKNSGYCFGVEYAIQMAEEELKEGEPLYCLGDIVHNAMEVERLEKMGLRIIQRQDLEQMQDCKVLIRAHGEPPETYRLAMENNIRLIDASCPVVLKLQNRVKNAYDRESEDNGQVVIYGKKGHAEVIGLSGQTADNAIVVTQEEDLEKIDFSRPITLFSQTTKSTRGFQQIQEAIRQRQAQAREDGEEALQAKDSICRQVSNREPQLREFVQHYDAVIFVSGKKSSNGRALFNVCKSVNPNSFFVESEADIEPQWLEGCQTVGVCGATSTPMWLMENVAAFVENHAVASQ